jgi:hypothetical protein
VNRRIGDYEILCRLATGGMANLYLARKSGIGRFEKWVAIKQILPEFAIQADFIRMFLDEARLAASLQHPNTVPVYEVGSADGLVFIVMEFLHGHDVRSIVQRGPMSLEHALAITTGVCAGLHDAHEKLGPDGAPLRIVHRDISPHNLFVTFDGVAKVIDFGIAKAADRLNHTRTNTLKGKLGYMSPEQVRGEALDRRSDVFALATVLHELLTGERLFQGANDYDVMKTVMEGELPPPSARNPAVPAELDHIVMRGLSRAPYARQPTAAALQQDLEAFARANGLDLTAASLRRFMIASFADEVDAWRGAQQAGTNLAEHFIAIGRAERLGDERAGAMQPVGSTRTDAPSHTGTLDAAAVVPRRRRTSGAGWAVLGAVLLAGGGLVLRYQAARRVMTIATPAVTPQAPQRATRDELQAPDVPRVTADSPTTNIRAAAVTPAPARRKHATHESASRTHQSASRATHESASRATFDPDSPLPR